MAMQSSHLLPALQELPGGESTQHRSFRDIITDVVNMDRAMYAAEFASSVSAGMWFIFDDVNVDDNIARAYETRWPNMAEERSLHEQWQLLRDSGEGTGENEWFFNGLKGQLAEFDAQERMEALGYTDVRLAPAANQEGWDISAIDPDGQSVLVQVKVGSSYSASDIQGLMEEDPDYLFILGSEIYQNLVEAGIDMGDRLAVVLNYEYVGGITDGLSTLSANNGIDIPDSIGDILPYAGAILAGARLIYSVIRTEREFAAADRTTLNKIQVVQSLTVMSRFGVSSVLAAAGGMGGTAIGTAVPGVGNLVGGIGGTLAGAGMGMYLNKHLQPRMLNLALGITGPYPR